MKEIHQEYTELCRRFTIEEWRWILINCVICSPFIFLFCEVLHLYTLMAYCPACSNSLHKNLIGLHVLVWKAIGVLSG